MRLLLKIISNIKILFVILKKIEKYWNSPPQDILSLQNNNSHEEITYEGKKVEFLL